jgi:hypothetical protein
LPLQLHQRLTSSFQNYRRPAASSTVYAFADLLLSMGGHWANAGVLPPPIRILVIQNKKTHGATSPASVANGVCLNDEPS